jgi:uncharacterized protein involved in outer membrane biogenesis
MEVSADNSPPKASRSWPRRHAVGLSIVVALMLLYTLGGFLWVPHVARTQAIAYVQHDLGRALSIGAMKFNPFTFELEIHDLKLAEADGAAIASVSMLHVEFNAMASLIHRAWTLADIRLQDPFVSVLVNHDGSLNLEKLVPPSKGPPPAPSTSLPRVRIGLFSVHQGSVHFEDRSREEPFTATLSPIEFDLNDFRTQADFENRYQFSAATQAGERFDWSGQFDLRPLASNGEFSVSGLKATTIASYLEDSLPCTLGSGTLDLKGQYQLASSQGKAGPAITVTLPSVQIHTLTIAPKNAQDGAPPWVSVPELDINDTRMALNEHSVSVGEIALKQPALLVWREANGSVNLQQLAGPEKTATATVTTVADARTATGATASPASAPAATPWKVTLAKLSINAADIAAEDRSVKPVLKLHIAPLNFTVQNASSEGTQPLSYDLDAVLADKGHLHTAGTMTLSPLAAQVGIELKDLDLSVLGPYVAQQASMSVYGGQAASEIKIIYADKPAKGQPQLKVTGSAQVTDLATRDNATNADFVSWSALQVSGLRYQMNPNALDIDRVYARGLYSRVIISPNGTINIKDVLQVPGAPPSAPPPPPTAKPALAKKAAAPAAQSAAPSMPIRIKRIDIEDSTANFADHSVEPNFSAGIVKLHGSIVGLSTAPSARAKVTLDGQVDEFAPVVIRGEVNPFAATAYTDLSLSFHNMELTTFNPYSGKYAGYSIDQGKLSTDLHYHIENRKLDATHHIVIDQLQFGAATESKQAVPLPIKLAVAILKDRDGVITLDLPEISGTIDDPQFKVGPLIWTFVVDLIKKVVTAPFAALGRLFGGGEEMSFVEFPVGTATITDSEQQKLAQLSKALVERPNLRLDVPLHAVSGADDATLAQASLDAAVTAAGTASGSKRAPKSAGGVNADQTVRLNNLLVLYRQKFSKEPEYPGEAGGRSEGPKDPNATPVAHIAWLEQQLLPLFKPTPDLRDVLGKARADAVQSTVLANKGLPPERVFLTERESSAGADGKVKMELKLQ